MDLVKCMPVAYCVLLTLDALGRTMTYGEFGRAIGLVVGSWEIRHRTELSNLLNLIAAIDRKLNGRATINFRVIVNANSGESGGGIERNNWRIVND